MPMKRYKPEQIVNLLRQIEVEIANGKTTPQACKEADCWRRARTLVEGSFELTESKAGKREKQEIKMRTNTEAVNKNANTNMLSVIEDLNQLISELEQPKYRALIRFAVAWQGLDRSLTQLERKLHERLAEKPISSVNELLRKLVKEN